MPRTPCDPVANRDHWLQLRRDAGITASNVSALFPEMPHVKRYTSLYALYQEVIGAIASDDLDGDERIRWGKRLEPVIAAGYRDDREKELGRPVILTDARWFSTHPDGNLGASIDYLTDEGEGPLICEIKNIDALIFWREWKADNEMTEFEVPLHIQLQAQAQLAAEHESGIASGKVVALVGGNRLIEYPFERNETIIESILERAAEFKRRVELRDPPPIDGHDATTAAIKKLYGESTPTDPPAELHDDLELSTILTERMSLKAIAADHAEKLAALDNQIKVRLEDIDHAFCGGWKVRFKAQKDTIWGPKHIAEAEKKQGTVKRKGARPLKIEPDYAFQRGEAA